MVGLIQRFLQVLVIVGVGFFIWRPETLPQPAQGIARNAQGFVFGNAVSWPGFVENWQTKWQFIRSTVPFLASAPNLAAQDPRPITADSVMKLIVESIMVQPVRKWNSIKAQFFNPVPVSQVEIVENQPEESPAEATDSGENR